MTINRFYVFTSVNCKIKKMNLWWTVSLVAIVYRIFVESRTTSKTLHSVNHLIKALGDKHINDIYPSKDLFVHTIDHAREQVSNDGFSHYIACVPYNQFTQLQTYLHKNKIQMHISYNSLTDNVLCIYTFLNIDEANSLEAYSALDFTVFEPVPNMARLDNSIHQLQYNFFLPSILREDDYISQETNEEHRTTGTASVSKEEEEEEETMITHPILLDAVAGSKISLSIILKPGISREKQEVMAAEWMESLLQNNRKLSHHTAPTTSSASSSTTTDSNSFADHIFWASPYKGTTLDVSDITNTIHSTTINGSDSHKLKPSLLPSKNNVLATKFKTKSGNFYNPNIYIEKTKQRNNKKFNIQDMNHTKIFIDKNVLQNTKKIPQKLQNIINKRYNGWKKWEKLYNIMYNTNKHIEECGFNELNLKHLNHNILITLPKQYFAYTPTTDTTDTTSNSTNSDNIVYNKRQIYGTCFAYLIATISKTKEITRIGLTRPIQTMNSLAREIIQLGELGSEPYSNIGLNGNNVVIGISDTGIDETSCYFRDKNHGSVPRSSSKHPTSDLKYRKVIQYITYSGSSGDYNNGHGSHVAGTVAGFCEYEHNNDAANVYKGIASGAKIAFFDVGINDAKQDLIIPDDLGHTIFNTAKSAGAHIHSNSWGGGYLYDAFTLATDQYLYENPDFLVVYAAGNSGYHGAYTVCSPALAKNSLAVAASNTGHTSNSNIDHIAAFSSNGPTLDGRNKPDITAPGNYLVSASARAEGSSGTSCSTTTKQGTSMATPVIAGTAGLISQYFQDSNFWVKYCDPSYIMCSKGPFTPTGTLMKALLLHSAKPIKRYEGNGGISLDSVPDTYQGYGRADLSTLLPTVTYNNAKFIVYMDNTGLEELQENTYNIHITSSTQALKVTISWYDPPNQVFAARYLLHDLDLVIEDPNGQIYLGNVPVLENRPALGANRDEINNNEQITIPSPILGDWTVHVQSKRLTEASWQNYSLVITAQGSVVPLQTRTKISPALLAECALSTGTPSNIPQVQLEVVLYAKLMSTGWSNHDYYTIQSAATIDSTATTLISNRLKDRALDIDKVCASAGCYTATLSIASEASKKGALVNIPECGVFLTPMNPVQDFCIVEPGEYKLNGQEIPVFSSAPCSSSCENDDHFLLPLYLGEYYEGAGWSSTYYSLQRIYDTIPPGYIASFEANSAGAGSMDWGYEEYQEHCLPKVDACYALQLSIPAAVVHNDEEYPVLYFLDTYLQGHTNIECPFMLNTTVTYAKICVHNTVNTHSTTTITFYHQNESVYDLGQALTKWSDLLHVQSSTSTTELGVCTGTLTSTPRKYSVNLYDTTDSPTVLPTRVPSLSPSTKPSRSPSAAPSTVPTIPPTASPSLSPTESPSLYPTVTSTIAATLQPTTIPTTPPSPTPTIRLPPPSAMLTHAPTTLPSTVPTTLSSTAPTTLSSTVPTTLPSTAPTTLPSTVPTILPSTVPANLPSTSPTTLPSTVPTILPSTVPANLPSTSPTTLPSTVPTILPSTVPTTHPSLAPITTPTLTPSAIPTFLPSVTPTATTTAVPTAAPSLSLTPNPTLTPTSEPTIDVQAVFTSIYGNHSVSCFSDCADYPDTVGFVSDMEKTCYFLADHVYHLCTSYSVAYGYCDIPNCAQDCTAEDWCYYGSGMVVGCPDRDWQGQSSDAAEIHTQCLGSLVTSGTDTPATDNSSNMSTTAQEAIIAITILIIASAIAMIIYCIYCARKPHRGDLLGDSTHSETGEALNRFPEDSSHSYLHSDSIEKGEKKVNKTTEPAGRSALGSEKLRSLLARSANFLRNKRKSPKTLSGIITGKQQGSIGHNNSRSSSNNKYQAVRSPFSIVGEEDEDDGYYTDGFEDSPQADTTENMDIRV